MNRILDFRVHYLCSSWSVRKLLSLLGAFPVAHWYRIHLPVQEMQETWVRSLGREDSLEEEMATHSSILAWKVPWTAEPSGLQSMGSHRVRHD